MKYKEQIILSVQGTEKEKTMLTAFMVITMILNPGLGIPLFFICLLMASNK